MATTTTTTTTTTPEPAPVRKGWASERATLAASGNLQGKRADHYGRYQRLADMLVAAEVVGESSISFAECNRRMQRNRKVGPEGAASWASTLGRFSGLVPEVGRLWRIDAEKGAIVRKASK